jgi:hypothetical protein
MVAEGAKPPGSSNGSAAAAAAGGAAARGGGGGLGAWWRQVTGQDGHAAAKAVHHHVSNVTNTVRHKAQTMKWSMPVDVKVDFLRPTLETMRDTMTEAFYSLPPPVQQAAPFVGVAAGSGLVVFLIQQRRVNHHVSIDNLTYA